MFTKLVNEIRNPGWEPVKGKRGGQRPMSFPESANFVEFLGRAGVGEAEAATLDWEHVGEVQIRFVRVKTGKSFFVQIDEILRPLVDRLRAEAEEAGGGKATGRVFTIRSAKKAIGNACDRLGYPHYSPRNFRSMFCVQLLQSGCNPKYVALSQGHVDGGKLVMDTYTEVTREMADERAYMDAQLAIANRRRKAA